MRLDKLLSTLGVCSRSGCRDMVRAGRIGVNGSRARDPGQQVAQEDGITLDGQRLDTRLTRHAIMNKPAGVLTAAGDARAKTVMDLLPAVFGSLGCMPVGRLDKDTTGLLLFTTDGELAHRLISPQRHVDKVYRATVSGVLTEADAAAFQAGIDLKDFTALPAKMELLCADTALVTVQEGKYHQVKRMFAAVGKPVLTLHRLRFGPLSLEEEMPEGAFRELTKEEAAALYRAAGMTDG